MTGRPIETTRRALVTGAAGFVGSHLVEHLIGAGWEVVGVDCVTPYYDVGQKRDNLAALSTLPGYRHLEVDLRSASLGPLLEGVDVVFHQAGQPGVRASWDDFTSYVTHNVLVTQRLLEAARGGRLSRFVYASSSSVYGDQPDPLTTEDLLPRPQSPYGVTKLAAEHLCGVYARNFGVPTVSLRYFTVYGPRQRPDMAMHRLIAAALSGSEFPLYGSGAQVRDFTYVEDVVAANIRAASATVPPGAVLNVAGGGAVSLADVIQLVELLTGNRVQLRRQPSQRGDVGRTGGNTDAARDLLDWSPQVALHVGLREQVRWHASRTVPALLAGGRTAALTG
jgi:UDP-glucuronate 4-epimerase